MTLTNTKITQLPIGKKTCDGRGLYLQLTGPKRGKWSFRYTIGGMSHEMGLGTYPEISLAEARTLREAEKIKLAKGKDPLLEKQRAARVNAEKSKVKFSHIAEDVIELKRPGWTSPKSHPQWRNTFKTYVYPHFDQKPLCELDRADVLAVLQPHWNSKHTTMRRLVDRMTAVFAYAKASGLYTGDNPAEWRNNLSPLLSQKRKPKHHPALDYRDLPQFFAELANIETIGSLALQFTILTAARTSEVIFARPDEIDLKRGIWRIPASRMKAREIHRVPLAPQAVALLEALLLGHNQPFIFPGRDAEQPLSNGTMHQLLRRQFPNLTATVHGFRSTFRTWAAEIGDYHQHLAEVALAHRLDQRVEGAYNHSDYFTKRKAMMMDYANYATQHVPERTIVAH